MSRNLKIRLCGLLMTLIFFGLIAYDWYKALNYKYFYLKSALALPLFSAIGLCLLFFGEYRAKDVIYPDNAEQYRQLIEEIKPFAVRKLSRAERYKLIPAKCWLVIFACFIGAIVNSILLYRFSSR